MEDFKSIVLGNMTFAVFGAYMFIALFVAFLMLLIRADKKRHDSPDTPTKFDWGFFVQDNLLKFVINILVIALMIRFSVEFVGQEITGWAAALIGLGVNAAVVKLQGLQNSARD
jgi:hypothetical protein